jgi:hypothetical protein
MTDRGGDTYPQEKNRLRIIVVRRKTRCLKKIFFSQNNMKKLEKKHCPILRSNYLFKNV